MNGTSNPGQRSANFKCAYSLIEIFELNEDCRVARVELWQGKGGMWCARAPAMPEFQTAWCKTEFEALVQLLEGAGRQWGDRTAQQAVLAANVEATVEEMRDSRRYEFAALWQALAWAEAEGSDHVTEVVRRMLELSWALSADGKTAFGMDDFAVWLGRRVTGASLTPKQHGSKLAAMFDRLKPRLTSWLGYAACPGSPIQRGRNMTPFRDTLIKKRLKLGGAGTQDEREVEAADFFGIAKETIHGIAVKSGKN